MGLLVNVLVLWTTLCMDRALAQPPTQGEIVNDEGVEGLPPFGANLINVLGRYCFSLPEAIARAEFRPLRDPADSDEEDLLVLSGGSGRAEDLRWTRSSR